MKIRMPSLSTLFFLLATAIVIFLMSPAWADDDHYNLRGSTSLSQSSALSNSGDKSFAIGGSDADIAGCRFTEGGLTIQWTRKDKFCQALKLIELGYVDTGVLAICTKTWIGKLYSDLAACQGALVAKYAPVVVAEPVSLADSDEDDDYHEDQMMLFEDLQAKVRNLEQDYEKQMQAPPQVIRRTVQQPYLSAEKKAKLREVVK